MVFCCLRAGGSRRGVGWPAENLCFPPILMAAREVRIHASTVGTRQDLREVLAMAAGGKIRCHVVKRPLAEANEALDLLRRGEVSGRIVLTPSAGGGGDPTRPEVPPAQRRPFPNTIA